MATQGEIFRAALHYLIPGASDVLNVFTWEYNGSGDDDADVLSQLDVWFTNIWGPIWDNIASTDNDMSFIEVDVINPDGTVDRNIGQSATPVAGLQASDTEPAPVSGLIIADTAVAKTRGKKYVPGAGDAKIVDGVFDATTTNDLLALLAAWLLPITVTGINTLEPGVLSRPAQAFRAFTGSGIVSSVPAYQRRRKLNVGE